MPPTRYVGNLGAVEVLCSLCHQSPTRQQHFMPVPELFRGRDWAGLLAQLFASPLVHVPHFLHLWNSVTPCPFSSDGKSAAFLRRCADVPCCFVMAPFKVVLWQPIWPSMVGTAKLCHVFLFFFFFLSTATAVTWLWWPCQWKWCSLIARFYSSLTYPMCSSI